MQKQIFWQICVNAFMRLICDRKAVIYPIYASYYFERIGYLKMKRFFAALLAVLLICTIPLASASADNLSNYASKDLPPQVVTPAPVSTDDVAAPAEEIPADAPEFVEITDDEIPIAVPQTGDNNAAPFILAAVLLAGTAFAQVFKKSEESD